MTKAITNQAASVHARLLNRAKRDSRPFDELLQYYAMERFLYRLSRSQHAEQFVLKGGLMLQLWGGVLARATKDIDLLGRITTTPDELMEIVRSCLAVEVDNDGLTFDTNTLAAEEIRLDSKYRGARVRFVGRLANARVTLQVDVGFGDIVTPGPQPIEYPSILELDPPRLLAYTPETTIAEKFHAMVVLDMANTRMKDFLDIWGLAHGRPFSGPSLAQALDATFHRRGTPLPPSTPLALTPQFSSAPAKTAQWLAYLRKSRIRGTVPALDQVGIVIADFLIPPLEALAAGRAFADRWPPGGPWLAPGQDGGA